MLCGSWVNGSTASVGAFKVDFARVVLASSAFLGPEKLLPAILGQNGDANLEQLLSQV